MPLDNLNQIGAQAPYLLPSLVGGTVGFWRRFQRAPDENHTRIAIRFGAHLGLCVFNGYLVASIGPSMGLSIELTGPACAIAGYLGGEALDWMENILRKRKDKF